MDILKVEGLKKSFGKVEVLKGIDFRLKKGEALAIIGSSGGGKTTLLRCLNFLEHAEEGRMYVNDQLIYDGADGKRHSDAEIRANRLHFGLVFQQFNLFPQYTALKNVMLAPSLLKIGTPEEREENARKILEQVGLAEKADFYPCQLSGGQQQRVAIARALALHPDILCFDEPTSALDPELTGEVLKVIRELKDKETTMIIVTHEMQFARDVADWVVFIDNGVIVEQGKPEKIFGNPEEERTRRFLERYSGKE